MDDRKLIQIMPATGVYAIMIHDGKEQAERIMAWGLYDDGAVEALVDIGGDLASVHSDAHFRGITEDVGEGNSDHLSSENAALARQVESMAMRIESLAEELAKPEDVRLHEVVDALDGRAVIYDGLGVRVTHLLDEMDEWIARAGEAERRLEDADAKLTAVRVALTKAGVPEVDPYPEEDVSDHEKSLRAGGRVIAAVARIERLAARLDDSKVSDEAKHDARELSYAVYEYDRTAKS